MIIVLDPSATIEIILNRKKAPDLVRILKQAEWVIAPQLYIAEISNVFWKYYTFSDLSKESCETGIDQSLSLIEEFFSEEEFYRESFAMACLTKLSVYDMLYAVLARRYDATLMTLDKKLKQAAKKHSINIA